MFKRILTAFAFLAIAIQPLAVSAVTVTTDLQGELIKGSNPAVYFYGEDGKRYVFPNDKIFFTWYSDFSSVREVSDVELADIPIGGNVTYRPGTKLVKVTTDPKVYAVGDYGKLRWIITEAIARALYGEDWAKQVQDVPDAFFGDYDIGDAIENTDDFEPATHRYTYKNIETLLEAKQGKDVEQEDSNTSSDHVIVVAHSGNGKVTWTDTETSSLGYKVVWSQNAHPTYPTREGDNYLYLSSSSAKSATINDLESGETYYVRVCEYLGGKCGAYSNEITVVGTSSSDDDEEDDTSDSSDHVIVISNAGNGKVTWTDTKDSPLGYKVVWSQNVHPIFPTREGDSYEYVNESYARSTVIPLESGKTYYVRVCEYLGGKCGAYSNEITVVGTSSSDDDEEDDTSDSSDHVIVVSNAGNGKVTWTDTETSSLGYKVVWSQNAHPTYPTREGDNYLYLSSSSAKSATINDLESGETYYVRVCEYLGGKCGAYSNEISVIGE